MNLLERLPGQDVLCLDQDENRGAPLAEPLLEVLLQERVFLTLEGGKEAFRVRIGGQFGDLGRKREGHQNRAPNHELPSLGHEPSKPIQRFLASRHERVCLLGARLARFL